MSDNNEILKFDPSQLMEGVKDRIKTTFVSLIPDEQWDGLVQREIDAFFQPVKYTNSQSTQQVWRNNVGYVFEGQEVVEVEMSPFRKLVWAFCEDRLKESLKQHVNETYFNDQWPVQQDNLKAEMKKIIEEATPGAIARFFNYMSTTLVNDMRNQLNNYR